MTMEANAQNYVRPSTLITYVHSYKCLGKISDNLHPNNQNNQLESRAWSPRDVQLNTQS